MDRREFLHTSAAAAITGGLATRGLTALGSPTPDSPAGADSGIGVPTRNARASWKLLHGTTRPSVWLGGSGSPSRA